MSFGRKIAKRNAKMWMRSDFKIPLTKTGEEVLVSRFMSRGKTREDAERLIFITHKISELGAKSRTMSDSTDPFELRRLNDQLTSLENEFQALTSGIE